jgi:hypothetical protein
VPLTSFWLVSHLGNGQRLEAAPPPFKLGMIDAVPARPA